MVESGWWQQGLINKILHQLFRLKILRQLFRLKILRQFFRYTNDIFFFFFFTPAHVTPALDDIEIIYQSSHYLVVNKKNDILINSNNGKDVTVQRQLRHLLPHLANPSLTHDFRFSHRLDYATSGLLCLSLNKRAAGKITKCFTKHHVDKYYIAIVRGHVSQNLIDVNLQIGDDIRPEWFGIRMVSEVSSFAKHCRRAHTRILLLQRGIYNDYPASKVLLKPCTGRRHQLRVHLSHLGHTLVGDYTYSNRCDVTPHRMFLHALRLAVPSPLDPFDVRTADPFSEDEPKNRWLPVENINTLDEQAFDTIKFSPVCYQVVR
ncbi:hypothetical protein Pmani_031507 [Petrolisthes manimaculis]|uniref:Pseudouridine synthase RsuA/RluA-like domain-containing protein n=1 Tax=Petrolisthes manimaculis TaxID=1843537 RepID=A0AAE1NTL5_9EUCA|nr:hypothetical protein Pmani_031507 [Petrolisthes manimaculis]